MRDRRECLEHLAELGSTEQSGIEHIMEWRIVAGRHKIFIAGSWTISVHQFCSSIVYISTPMPIVKKFHLSLTMKLKILFSL